eukprot:TRINITY_DN1780_c0_g1_i1.p1 TRINITY_DN1780_c0_g1~~TRINITY_DN1780_c0_g1_i1.p1  ORF type:complete len:305 (+),score=71.70 TRINITY_DN1780_c0_g1_i1:185-1099(+)
MDTEGGSELLECPICCELFNNATETFCGHAFCEYCIARCLEHEPDVCPVCRNDPSPIHPSFTIRRVVEEWRKLKGIAIEESARLGANEEKQTGNNHYLKGEYADAIKHYTNAIEESPSAILFGNRATAFFKINQWKMSLYDCDKAIKMDPTYVKAYLRKGYCLEQMREYSEAYKTLNEVKRLDKSGALREETDQAIKRVHQLAALQTAVSTAPNGDGAAQQNSQQQPYPQQPFANVRPPPQSSYPGNQYSQPQYPPQNSYPGNRAPQPPNTYRHYEPYNASARNPYPASNQRGRRESRGDCSIQ